MRFEPLIFIAILELTLIVIFKVELKKSRDFLIFDRLTFEWLTSEPYLCKIDFINNLEKNKDELIVFDSVSEDFHQITISLIHLLTSEFFQSHLSFSEKCKLIQLNGNHLDFRLENLSLEILYVPQKNTN